jgi:hypothetical protein
MMALNPNNLPAPIRTNDEMLRIVLVQTEQMDSRLAEVLWECYSRGYYKAFGFRSVSEYLRERWAGTDMEQAASLKSRSVLRLIREYRIAREIPLFRQNFDAISRSNRRLIAQILTVDNAAEWIEAAQTLTTKALEARLKNRPEVQREYRQRLYMSIYPQTREIWERAKAAARRVVEEDGGDPALLTDALCLEMICADFLSAFGEQVELLSDTVTSEEPVEPQER